MTAMITAMIMITVVMVHPNGHYCKGSKVGWVIAIIIRWIIRYIGGRIYILHNWHLLNHYNGS